MKPNQPVSEFTLQDVNIAVLAPTVAITLSELLFRVMYDVALRGFTAPGYYLIYGTPVIFAFLGSIAFGYAMIIRGRQHLILLSALVVLTFVVSNFRGSHRWQGFYDMYADPRSAFIGGLCAAVILSLVVVSMLPRVLTRALFYGSTLVALAWSWFDSVRVTWLYTSIPYTRQLALSVVVICLAITAWLEYRGYEFDEGESFS